MEIVLGNGDEGERDDGLTGEVDRLSNRFKVLVERQAIDDDAAVKDIDDLQGAVKGLQGAVAKLQAAKRKASGESKVTRGAVAAIKKRGRK